MVTTLYQGRPADTARSTIDHQTQLDQYGILVKAVATAEQAAVANDAVALRTAVGAISSATATLSVAARSGASQGAASPSDLTRRRLWACRVREPGPTPGGLRR
jgi:hypothetical protein